jgi:hypothetical protein
MRSVSVVVASPGQGASKLPVVRPSASGDLPQLGSVWPLITALTRAFA